MSRGRVNRGPPRAGDGPLCPTGGESHGPMIWMTSSGRYFCPHEGHSPRNNNHPNGPGPGSKCFWFPNEIQ